MNNDDNKLTWDDIERLYNGEWVELTEYEWPDEEINPRSGTVRVHAPTREQFDKLAAENPPQDSAYVFVGDLDPEGEIVLNTHSTIEIIRHA